MATILGTNKTSKCIFCGAQAYGIGCAYSPHHKHVHCDDPKRCVYCGSQAYGVGCPYNPFGNMHIHGVQFNTMMKESAHSSFTAGLFLSRLIQPIKESLAYKLGIIDVSGRKIRDTETVEEKASYTALDAYIFKLRRLIGEENLSLLNASVIVEKLSQDTPTVFNEELYTSEMKMKHRIKHLVEEYHHIVQESMSEGIPTSTVENAVIEEILKQD